MKEAEQRGPFVYGTMAADEEDDQSTTEHALKNKKNNYLLDMQTN